MPGENNNRKNGRKKKILLIVLVAVLIVGLGYYFWTRGRVRTDDAFVDGRIYAVTPRVDGYVVEVLVEDNQEVSPGQALVRLDPAEFEVALAEAKAALAEAESQLASLELGVPLELDQTSFRVSGARARLESLGRNLERVKNEEDAAIEDLKRAQAQYDQAELDLQRMQRLAETGAVARSDLDNAETAAESARAQLSAAKARAQAVRKQKASIRAEMDGIRAEIGLAATGEGTAEIKSRQVEAQRARVELAKARVRQAELDLKYTTLVSPAHGYVTKKNVEPGQPLLAIVPLDPGNIWVTANYKETQLTRVKPGQRVEIEVDAYPGLKLTGKVQSIMAGTGAAFSLFPPENASGNYVKVVQRVPVKIALDGPDGDDAPKLRIGMSVVPTIFVGE